VEHLLKDGFERSKVDALMMPAGMNIRASTPAQIAVSIVAEILAEAPDADDFIHCRPTACGDNQ
jgi:xanthine/CO dehydrogenase XdhC/CoxF family maturation factor